MSLKRKTKKLPKRHNKNFPYKLAMVWWEDIVSDASWNDIIDIQKQETAVCCSVGWLVYQDQNKIILMADFSFEPNEDIKQGGSSTVIPQKNVLKIKSLKV